MEHARDYDAYARQKRNVFSLDLSVSILKMVGSQLGGYLLLLLLGSSSPTCPTWMPDVSCLLSDVGVTDAKRKRG